MIDNLLNTLFSKSAKNMSNKNNASESSTPNVEMVQKSALDEAMDDYRRLKSRFDKTVAEQSKATIKSFAIKIITIISDFETGSDVISQMIVRKLKALLETYNIVPMGVSVGDAFNVKYHNAVRQEENVATTDDNTIMIVSSVIRDGYVMDDEVISYAMVSVKPWCKTENSNNMDETNNYMSCE